MEKLITQDVRNNSAWNHRWFTCHRADKSTPLSNQRAIVEANYAIDIAGKDPFNESPWRYLIGILKEQWRQQEKTVPNLLDEFEGEILKIKSGMAECNRADGNSCVNLISALVDVLEMKQNVDAFRNAANFAHNLAFELDPIRKKYWMFRKNKLTLMTQN